MSVDPAQSSDSLQVSDTVSDVASFGGSPGWLTRERIAIEVGFSLLECC